MWAESAADSKGCRRPVVVGEVVEETEWGTVDMQVSGGTVDSDSDVQVVGEYGRWGTVDWSLKLRQRPPQQPLLVADDVDGVLPREGP